MQVLWNLFAEEQIIAMQSGGAIWITMNDGDLIFRYETVN